MPKAAGEGYYKNITRAQPGHPKRYNMLKKTISDAYGEILPISVTKLIKNINFTDEDIFFDLGSGRGKLLTQIFLESPVQKAIGIELHNKWHQQALLNRQMLQDRQPESFLQRHLEFIQADFQTADLSEATVALIASPCFTLSQLRCLGEKLDIVPALHTILTLKPLLNLTRFHFQKTIRLEGSWDTSLCYVYRASKL